GYSPMYSNNNETNFEIYDLELNGNEQINNVIKNRLEKYFKNNKEKKYIIKIKTSYEKISATKDRTGSTTHFKLIVRLALDYKSVGIKQNEKGQSKILSFSESTIIKKNQDNFEQNDYENITIKNISELLINKVIIYLERS
ncbi:hypothetical protein OA436_03050, partial [Candidatus Pelagibacter sp.]|nr:hypothetical protein [Candidatus Pelagibacter sp.]